MKNIGLRSALRHPQKGASAIEFAVLLPLMLIICYGIVCYALILLDKQSLSAISAAAARNAATTKQADLIPARVQQAIDEDPWMAGRIVPCGTSELVAEGEPAEEPATYHSFVGDQLQVCLQARPVAMPAIKLGIFQIPPADLSTMLRSTATVLWEP
jgi:hypothetical protein